MEHRESEMGGVSARAAVIGPAEAAPVGRRELAALVGALAGLAATGCASYGEGEKPMEELGQVAEALSGTALRWVDTVVGAGRTGDLATKTSALLGNAIVVIAKACVAAGDGGGGVFYWETTSGGDNGGTIIVPTGGGGRWVRIYSGPLDVRWFGARKIDPSISPDTDNSDPIQKAINAAGAAGGGTVLIPPGTYVTTARNLLPNVMLVGAGPAQSVLKLKDSTKEPILYTSGADNCGIRDLGFDGNNATQSGANQSGVDYDFQPVRFDNCNDLHIENIFINRGIDATKGTFGPSSGLYITTCLRFRVHNVEVTGNGAGDGIQVLNSAKFELVNLYVHNMAFDVSGATNDQLEGISLDSCTEWTLVNPRVHDLTGNGTRSGVSHPNLFTRGIQTSNCTRFSIVGGHIAHVDQGIDLTGRPNEEWQIANVITQECYSFGIKCANLSRDGQVSNCTADRCGQTGFVVSPPSGPLAVVASPNEPGFTGPSADIQFVGCVAYDIGYNGNPSTHSGFRVQLGNPQFDPPPGTARGIRFIGCKAHDRQATPTMAYGFLNEVPPGADGRYNEAIDCVSLRHTIDAFSGMHSSHCEVGLAAPQSIPNNAWTVVNWSTHVDDGAMHDTASNNSNVLVRRAGTYIFQFGVVFAPNGAGQRGARILQNGVVVPGTTILNWPAAGGQTSVFTSTIRRLLDAGDSFRLEVFQDSGSTVNLQTTSAGVVEQVG
jgi:hypothetical protein